MLYRHIKFDSVMRYAVVTLTGLGARIILWSLGSQRSSGLVIVTPPSKPVHEALELFLSLAIHLIRKQVQSSERVS